MAATREVVVTGIGLVTALGDSALETWTRLMAGESAIALRQPFSDLAVMPLAMQGKQPVLLAEMTASLAQQTWADAGLCGKSKRGKDKRRSLRSCCRIEPQSFADARDDGSKSAAASWTG